MSPYLFLSLTPSLIYPNPPSYNIIPLYHTLSLSLIPYPSLSYPIPLYHTLSLSLIPYSLLSYPIPLYHTLSLSLIPYPSLSYPIPFSHSLSPSLIPYPPLYSNFFIFPYFMNYFTLPPHTLSHYLSGCFYFSIISLTYFYIFLNLYLACISCLFSIFISFYIYSISNIFLKIIVSLALYIYYFPGLGICSFDHCSFARSLI